MKYNALIFWSVPSVSPVHESYIICSSYTFNNYTYYFKSIFEGVEWFDRNTSTKKSKWMSNRFVSINRNSSRLAISKGYLNLLPSSPFLQSHSKFQLLFFYYWLTRHILLVNTHIAWFVVSNVYNKDLNIQGEFCRHNDWNSWTQYEWVILKYFTVI